MNELRAEALPPFASLNAGLHKFFCREYIIIPRVRLV
jgi:hypothetical protein